MLTKVAIYPHLKAPGTDQAIYLTPPRSWKAKMIWVTQYEDLLMISREPVQGFTRHKIRKDGSICHNVREILPSSKKHSVQMLHNGGKIYSIILTRSGSFGTRQKSFCPIAPNI